MKELRKPTVAWVYAFATPFLEKPVVEVFLDPSDARLCDRETWKNLNYRAAIVRRPEAPSDTTAYDIQLSKELSAGSPPEDFYRRVCTALPLKDSSIADLSKNFASIARPQRVVTGENFYFATTRLLSSLVKAPVLSSWLQVNASKQEGNEADQVLHNIVTDARGLTIRNLGEQSFNSEEIGARLDKALKEGSLSALLDAAAEAILLETGEQVLALASWRRGRREGLQPNIQDDSAASVKRLRQMCRDDWSVGGLFGIVRRFEMDLSSQIQTDPAWLVVHPFANDRALPSADYQPIPVRIQRVIGRSPVSVLVRTRSTASRPNPLHDYFVRRVVARPMLPWVHSESVTPVHNHDAALVMRRSVLPAISPVLLRKVAARLKPTFDSNDALKDDDPESLLETIITNRLPYDAIGITWDQDEVAGSLKQGEDDLPPDYHVGFKGYRVDVKFKGSSEWTKWQSLAAVERYIVDEAGRRYFRGYGSDEYPAEGFCTPSLLGEPGNERSTKIVVGSHFVAWAGSSSVAQDPLDALGRPGGQAAAKEPGATFEDHGQRIPHLAYTSKCRFRVRKLGLIGTGPRVSGPIEDSTTNAGFAWAELDFRRGTPMAAPVVEQILNGITEATDPKKGPDQPTHWKATANASVVVRARMPLAHWRVAYHATADERYASLDQEFSNACLAFAMRVEKKKASAGVSKTASAAGDDDYLTAVDPHLDSIEVVSSIWYPFSDRQQQGASLDDFVPIGRVRRPRPDIRNQFRALVARAQRAIDRSEFHFDTTVPVAQPGLGAPDVAASPQVIPGAPVRIECAGVPRDGDWAQTWFAAGGPLLPASTGIAKWSSNLHIVDMEPAQAKPIGLPRGVGSIGNARTHYCGVIGDGFFERQLEAIPAGVSEPIEDYLPPVRGGVQSWRAFFFDDPATSPPTLDRQTALLRFAAARLGGTIESDPEHKDELRILLSAADPNGHLVAGFNWPTPIVLSRADRGVRVNLGTYSKPRGAADVKQLPFVDQDIRWIVRLSWNVPLEKGSLHRPRDLMFVKEFRVYREELKFGAASPSPSKSIEDIEARSTLVGNLERPGADVFATKPNGSRVNLDEVEWLWIDAVADSDPHRYVYHVVAVPEHERLFQKAVWFEKEVVLPASGIARRPLLLPLPLKTTTKPLVGLHVRDLESDDGVRARATLIYRTLQTQPDPALGRRQPGPIPRQEMGPPTLASIFPRSVEELKTVNATTVPPVPDTIGHGWKVAERAMVEGTTNTHPSAWVCDLTVPAGAASLPANPSEHAFARLHVALWARSSDHPRLLHSAVTDLTQTDWLQVYPNPLRQITAQNRSIRIGDAWPTTKDNIIWRRFHIFLAGSGPSDASASYHVETFYRQAAELQLDSISDRIATVLGGLIEGPDVLDGATELDLVAVAEEGILAQDYVLEGDKDTPGRPQFVVMRKPGSSVTIKCSWNESTRRWVC